MPNEYICHDNCRIIKTIHIENVGQEIKMRFPHINIIKYEESDDYWEIVRGGREGYLQRRKERVEKLCKSYLQE